MTQFRYHRVAANKQFWQRPHGGRLGSDRGFVGENGWGVEDWNFSRDIWDDGRTHLYLTQKPAVDDRDKVFNIALGEFIDGAHWLIGFAEHASFALSELPGSALERRATELSLIQEEDQLGSDFVGLDRGELRKKLRDELTNAWVSLDPKHLFQLQRPMRLPQNLSPKGKRYQLLHLSEEDYYLMKDLARDNSLSILPGKEQFPEGALITTTHITQERSAELVRKAKQAFIAKHGHLFCEICAFAPQDRFGAKMQNKIIEAHHDVPLSTYENEQDTKVSDLKMLCPTCHSAVHAWRPWQLVSEFKKLVIER